MATVEPGVGGLINERLGALTDYPFARLTKLLNGVQPRANEPVINMSVGELQSPPPALIAETLTANAHLWGKYPVVAGTEDFREAAGSWLRRRFALPEGSFDPHTMLLPASGTREALFQLALTVVPARKAGRQPAVLIPNPFYAVYEGAAVLAGAEPVFLASTKATGFLPDLDALPVDLLERTALFYLCTPSNPQGAAASAAYLRRAIELARRYGFVLAVDECYAELYLDAPPAGALEVAASMPHAGSPWANIAVFHSLSKRSSAAGLRSGFVAGDPAIIGPFARTRSYALAGMPLPVAAASAALWRDEEHVAANRAALKARMAVAEEILTPRFGAIRPAGGFFLWLDVGDSEKAASRLWEEGGVRVLPGAYLSRPVAGEPDPGQAFIRVALVHDEATVARACATIARLLV
jgi:N-succinyldiaminopimelate aminotransferase